MLIAHCHLRREQRYFRLDRMEDLTLLKQTFTRPANFKIQLSPDDDRTVIVRAIFDHDIGRRVQESPSLYQLAQENHPDGSLLTFAVRQESDILHWLLSWGSHVQVLEPQSLIDLMAHEAEAMLQKHSLRERLDV
jgi:predicted DNA-binding transcriptional regulator YafY